MEQKLEALNEANNYIKRLSNGINETILCFRNKDFQNGYKMVGMITEGIEWLLDIFKLTEDIQVEKISVENLNDIWSEMIGAIESKDDMLLADMLEFEVIGKVELWKKQLDLTIKYYNKQRTVE